MRQKSNTAPVSSENLVRDIRRATRKHHAAEEKIRIVLDGLRGETSIAELCRREGIAESITMRIFSSAAWCFRVARRMLRTRFSDVTGVELDFCLIFAPWGLR